VASYYLDTSALVKAFAREQGTAWVTALVEPAAGHALYTVRLTGPEMVAALGRKARTGELTAAASAQAVATFRRSWRRRPNVVAATVALTERAMDLAAQHVVLPVHEMGVAGPDLRADARRGGHAPGHGLAVQHDAIASHAFDKN